MHYKFNFWYSWTFHRPNLKKQTNSLHKYTHWMWTYCRTLKNHVVVSTLKLLWVAFASKLDKVLVVTKQWLFGLRPGCPLDIWPKEKDFSAWVAWRKGKVEKGKTGQTFPFLQAAKYSPSFSTVYSGRPGLTPAWISSELFWTSTPAL